MFDVLFGGAAQNTGTFGSEFPNADFYLNIYDNGGGGECDIIAGRRARSCCSRTVLEKTLTESVEKGATVGLGFTGLCYPSDEAAFRLTERALEVIYDTKNPVVIITKSDLILRDAGLISTIAKRSAATVAVPIFCGGEMSEIFERGATPPAFRYEIINRLSASGIRCGVLIKPVIPFFTDSRRNIREIVKKAAESGADFVSPDFGLLLAEGQKEPFFRLVDTYFHGFSKLFATYKGNYFSIPRREFVIEAFLEEYGNYW